jgi:hypothetical protein
VDFTVPVLDAADTAQDVTGWTATATVRVGRPGSTVLHTFTATPGTDGVRITADAADTAGWADWAVSVARWALWVTPPGGDPDLLAAGWVRVAG